MRRVISGPLLSVVANIAARRESHATLDGLFTYAGAPGDPPPDSKPAKAMAWLRRANKDESVSPMQVLGKVIETYMEELLDPEDQWDRQKLEDRVHIERAPQASQLQYVQGGNVVGSCPRGSHACSVHP
jgi:hypothetical protein